MSAERFSIDDKEVQRFCRNMQRAAIRKQFLRSVSRGMGLLARDTNARYKRLHPTSKTKRTVYKRLSGGRWKKQRRQIATVATKRRENLVMVHIMGDYRAKWLEKGTRERHTKGYRTAYSTRRGRGRRTGRVRPEWFFKMAQVATARQVEQRIARELDKQIASLT